MSGRHPDERAFQWLIVGLMASVPIGLVVSGLYPRTSRRIWVLFWESVRVGFLWVLNVLDSIPGLIFTLAILAVFGFFALGILWIVLDAIRGLLG